MPLEPISPSDNEINKVDISIAIACHYADVNLVACELDVKYYESALKRIKEQTVQVQLFH